MRLCVSDECCLDEDALKDVVDCASRVKALIGSVLSRAPSIDQSALRDSEAIYYAALKVVGAARALSARVKNLRTLRELQDVDTVVNTFVNTLNRLVEIRNLIQRLAETLQDAGIDSGVEALNKCIEIINSRSVLVSSIALHTIHELPNISRDHCGKLASAIGTALFAALLSLTSQRVREALAKCFPRRYTAHRGP